MLSPSKVPCHDPASRGPSMSHHSPWRDLPILSTCYIRRCLLPHANSYGHSSLANRIRGFSFLLLNHMDASRAHVATFEFLLVPLLAALSSACTLSRYFCRHQPTVIQLRSPSSMWLVLGPNLGGGVTPLIIMSSLAMCYAR
jgi:hypothetical protein